MLTLSRVGGHAHTRGPCRSAPPDLTTTREYVPQYTSAGCCHPSSLGNPITPGQQAWISRLPYTAIAACRWWRLTMRAKPTGVTVTDARDKRVRFLLPPGWLATRSA